MDREERKGGRQGLKRDRKRKREGRRGKEREGMERGRKGREKGEGTSCKHNMYIVDILNSNSLSCKLTCALILISPECILFICTSLDPPSILPRSSLDPPSILPQSSLDPPSILPRSSLDPPPSCR